MFKSVLTDQHEDNMPLKNDVQIMNAVEHLTPCIQKAAWSATAKVIIILTIRQNNNIILTQTPEIEQGLGCFLS